MNSHRHACMQKTGLFLILALVANAISAQNVELINTNANSASGSAGMPTNTAPPAIKTPYTNAPVAPRKPAISSELRKSYHSARGASSTSPNGPARITLKPPARENDDQKIWDSTLEAGLTLNRGNTDTEQYLLRIETKRKKDESEFYATAQGQYGESDGNRDKESAQGRVRYSLEITERTYQSFELRGYYDALAEIDYQMIATWSYGYKLIQTEDSFLSVEAGPGYVAEKKLDQTDGYVAAHLAERGEVRANENVIIWHAFDYFPSLEDSSRYLITAEAGIESIINSHLRFRAALQDRYDSAPAEDKEENDLATLLSLVIAF